MTEMRKRFESNIRITPGCWIWLASVDTQGYGQSYSGRRGRGAHRVSYELYNAPIPPKMQVLHACDNGRCVNPDHLFIGTHQDNMRDRNNKGRQAHNNGELGGGAKLTAEKVKAIKADQRVQTEIAHEYAVCQKLISLIKRGKRWAHIQEAV